MGLLVGVGAIVVGLRVVGDNEGGEVSASARAKQIGEEDKAAFIVKISVTIVLRLVARLYLHWV